MKTKKFLSMAALALVGAMMTGCSSEDNIDNPQQPENKTNVVTLTATVGFDDGVAATRAVTGTGVKTFADGDQIAVIYKNSSDQTLKAVGTITSGAGTKTATFTVTLSAPKNSEPIRYIYPAAMAKETIATNATIDDDGTVDFTKLNSQNGSLTTLGSSLDLCTFDAPNWTSGTLPNGNLANQLAILAITVKDNATPTANDITSTITTLSVGDGTNVYSVSRSAAAGPIYVAIKPTTSATIGVNASDGAKRYYKELTTKTYAISNGYSVNWKMNEGGAHLSALTGDYTANGGETLKGTLAKNVKVSIADGATVTLNNVNINGVNDNNYEWAGITCLGDATIILSGTNTVKGFYDDYPGIQAAAGKTLIINGAGSLTASSYGRGAGIGGGSGVACGNIEIQGGTITATSVQFGAGIGGGNNASCGNITISGGTVTATGGASGAGIGSGKRGNTIGSCGDILISGGTVEATGGDNAAGIGGGKGYSTKKLSSCGNITITSGVTSVTATKGNGAPNSIGAGNLGTCGTVKFGTQTMYEGSSWTTTPTSGSTYSGLNFTIPQTTYANDTWTLTPHVP